MGSRRISSRRNGDQPKAQQMMREVALATILVALFFSGAVQYIVKEIQQDIAWHKLMAVRKEFDDSIDMRTSRSHHPTAIRVKR